MALRKIARIGHPVLRRRATEVAPERITSAEVQTLIADMIETMHDANGAGIAAPQVYESWRIAVVEVRENPRYPMLPAIPLVVLVNPVLTPLVGAPDGSFSDEESVTMYEGCLSVPGLRGRVKRPRKIRVEALDPQGKPLCAEWEGPAASVFQHECDHLDGVLFVDRAEPRTLTVLEEYERHVPGAERIVDGAHRG